MKTVYLKAFSVIPHINLKSGYTAFFFSASFHLISHIFATRWLVNFWAALSIMAEKYVNNEKNIQILWLKTSIFQIFRKIVKLEYTLTHCFIIFFKFFKEKTALTRTYTTPLHCFRTVFKENAAGYSKTACKLY